MGKSNSTAGPGPGRGEAPAPSGPCPGNGLRAPVRACPSGRRTRPLPSLLPGLVLGLLLTALPSLARAAEIKATGEFQAVQSLSRNWNFQSSRHRGSYQDENSISQRLRLGLDFLADEDLKATVELQMGTSSWGQGGLGLGQGDAAPTGSFSPMVRQAFIETVLPDTDITLRAGYMDFALASSFAGSPLLEDSSAGALVLSMPLVEDALSITAGYLRPWDTFNATGQVPPRDTAMDAVFLTLPMEAGESLALTPYALFAWGGRSSLSQALVLSEGDGDGGLARGLMAPGLKLAASPDHSFDGGFTAWWTGLSANIREGDHFWVGLDLIRGQFGQGWKANSRQGWFADLGLGWKGLEIGPLTLDPVVFAAWSSGEDADPANGSERLPVLENYFSVGSFYFEGSSFSTGDMGNQNDQIGFWTVGLSLKDITWTERLSQDIHVLYIRGTNSHRLLESAALPASRQWDGDYAFGTGSQGGFLTDKDSLWEFDLNTSFQVYEELTAVLELGWIRQGLNREVWNSYYARGGDPGTALPRFKGTDATKMMLGMIYEF